MPSPFPGMDPYLEEERLWPSFHHLLLLSLNQILTPALGDRYRARMQQRRYVTETALFTSVVREEREEEYIEIHQRSDGRLVTLLEVVSPCNKTTAQGRSAYLTTRAEGKDARANLVELDLVLQGRPTLEYSRDNLPECDYVISVTRTAQPDRYEIYTSTLQKRLPRFRLPLGAEDRDTVIDLHSVFTRCYDHGGFVGQIDYSRDPSVSLDEADRRWLRELLQQNNLR